MATTLKFGNGEWYGKKDTILAYNDENNNYKPLPFDFSRGSSATVINKDGLIETVGSGEPRIDYKDNTKGALLLEPSRTNLFTYSNDFTNSDWSKQAVAISPNSIIGLDGALSASVLARSTGVLQSLRMNMSLVVGNSYTISCWAKADFDRYITLGFTYSAGNYAGTQFDLQNGTILRTASSGTGYDATNPNIEEFDNGWYRVSVTLQTGVADSYPCFIGSNTIWNSGWFNINEVGDGVNGLYLYGAQLEQGSYETSYIPTSGSSVTRIADICNNGGNEQVINSTEGVFYFNSSTLQDTADRKISLSDGTSTNRIEIVFVGLGNLIYMDIKNSNGLNLGNNTTISSSVSLLKKYAVRWSNNNYSFWVNGVKEIEVLTGNTFNPNSLSTVNLSNYSNSQDFYGKVKDLRVYNTALTDQELIALTTI